MQPDKSSSPSARRLFRIRKLGRLGRALLAAAFLTATPGLEVTAWAAPRLHEASKVLRMNREAMDLFEELEFELARSTLQDALKVIQKAELGEHLVASRTHGNLAVVYAVGLKNQARAIEHFRAALAVRTDFELPAELAAGEAQQALERARRGDAAATEPTLAAPDEVATESPPPEPAASATRAKGSAAALRCPTAGDVAAGDDLTLRCVTGGGLSAASVIMFYKRQGEDDFTTIPMKMQAGQTGDAKAVWTANIPGSHVQGKWLPFYFEARDNGGDALAMSGRYDSPSLLSIKGGEITASAKDTEEDPLARPAEGTGPGETNREGLWFVGLGVGSGGGYAAGGFEVYENSSFTPGLVGPRSAHALPEIGYYISPTIALSLQGRHQYIPRPDTITAGGANSVLLRGLFYLGQGASRFYGSVAVGGGEGIRLVMEAPEKNDTGMATGKRVQDTVRGGPVLAGAGAGWSHDFTGVLSWVIEVNLLAGVPTFSAAYDVNTAMRASF